MTAPRPRAARAPQHGVAVVLAMGVVALAALAATAMLVSQSTWSRQAELNAGHAQARLLIEAGLDWARAVLSDDRSISNVDHPGEQWALRPPPVPVDNGSLAGQIEDEQGKFNLNNILSEGKVEPVQLAQLRRLLEILELPPALAGALADWIDSDREPQPQDGAEDAYYLALRAPYFTANRALIDLAELALVRGFDDNVRARLRPFVTALPRFTAVNANTAAPEVIAAVIEGLGLDAARAMVEQRERAYFRNYSDFFSQLPAGLIVAPQSISVSSDYFMATTRVTVGGARAQGSALLARGSAGWPVIVWRKSP
jgi:general secretion pathway protein K